MLELNDRERIGREKSMQRILRKLSDRFSELVWEAKHPPAASGGSYKSGFWRRKSSDVRKVCLDALKFAVIDVATILLLAIIIITFYRFPNLVGRLAVHYRRGGISSTRLRLVLKEELRGLCDDILHCIHFCGLFTLVAITIVRFPRFIGDIPSCTSLPDAIVVAQTHLRKAIADLWQLFSLLFVWDTYVVIIRVVFYAIFVPAASFASLLHMISRKHAGKGLRFLISGLLWLCCFLTPVVLLQSDNTIITNPDFRIGVMVSIIVMVSAIILFNLLIHATNADRLRFSDKVWRSPIVRPTLPNIASLIHIVFAPLQLLLAFALLMATNDELKSETHFGFFSKETVESFLFLSTSNNILTNEKCRTQGIYVYDPAMISPPTGSVISLFVVLMWIYLVTVPLTIRDDNKRIQVQESSAYRNFSSVISEGMYLLVIVNLIQPLLRFGENRQLNAHETDIPAVRNRTKHHEIDPSIAEVGSIAAKDFMTCAVVGLAYFIFTTLAESTRNRGAESSIREQRTDVGHDLQYTEIYNLIYRALTAFVVVLCLVFCTSEHAEIIGVIATFLIGLLLLWNIFYKRIIGVDPSSVPWVIPLHVGSLMSAELGCILMLIDRRSRSQTNSFVAWGVASLIIAAVSICISIWYRHNAAEERKRFKEKSGLTSALSHLFKLESKLLLDDSLMNFTGKSRLKSKRHLERISTPVFLAHAVLNLEKQILCENYQSTFVHATSGATNRLENWRDRLRKPDITFRSIASLIEELTCNLRPPHYVQFVKNILKDKFHSHELYNYEGIVMYNILEFLYGKNLNAYEVVHRKCYDLLAPYRIVSEVSQHNVLLPYVPIPVESPYYKWMQIFDSQAIVYWNAYERDNVVTRTLNSLRVRQPVMAFKEFCELPDAMIAYEGDKKVKHVDPYFRAAYNSYNMLVKTADMLHREGKLDAEKRSNLRRCSIKFLYENARKFYFENERFEYASEIKRKINAEFFFNRHILSKPVTVVPEV